MPTLWLKAFFDRHRGNERVGGTPLCFRVWVDQNNGLRGGSTHTRFLAADDTDEHGLDRVYPYNPWLGPARFDHYGFSTTAVASSQRALSLSMERYKSGIDSYLNVITAQTTLLNNQRTAVNLQAQQMTASVELIKALGGGWNASELPTPKQLK